MSASSKAANAVSDSAVQGLSASPSTLGEGGGEGLLTTHADAPHPNPLPEYWEREHAISGQTRHAPAISLVGEMQCPRPLRRGRRVRYAVLFLLLTVFTPIFVFRAAVRWWPYPGGISDPPPANTVLLDRAGIPLATLISRTDDWHTPLTDEQICPHLLQAIVAVEDSRFYEHGGVDWKSVAGAAWEDFRYVEVRRGASTITMQLQHLRQPRPRTFWNKFAQAIRADQMERPIPQASNTCRISQSRSLWRKSRWGRGRESSLFRPPLP